MGIAVDVEVTEHHDLDVVPVEDLGARAGRADRNLAGVLDHRRHPVEHLAPVVLLVTANRLVVLAVGRDEVGEDDEERLTVGHRQADDPGALVGDGVGLVGDVPGIAAVVGLLGEADQGAGAVGDEGAVADVGLAAVEAMLLVERHRQEREAREEHQAGILVQGVDRDLAHLEGVEAGRVEHLQDRVARILVEHLVQDDDVGSREVDFLGDQPGARSIVDRIPVLVEEIAVVIPRIGKLLDVVGDDRDVGDLCRGGRDAQDRERENDEDRRRSTESESVGHDEPLGGVETPVGRKSGTSCSDVPTH